MNYKVAYFSRTGSSKRIAQKIANKLSCDMIEVTDNMNWSGAWGFLKAAYFSLKGKEVQIKLQGSLEDAEEIVLVAPLWAGEVAPAVKAFTRKFPSRKTHLVVSSNSSSMKNSKVFDSYNDIIKSKGNEDLVILGLTDHLKQR